MGARLREYIKSAGKPRENVSTAVILGGRNLDLEINKVVARLNAFAEEITDPNRKIRALKAAGKLVAESARNFAPKYPGTAIQKKKKNPKEHYRYDTPKIFKGLRAPKGEGRKKATYLAGHLRKSIQVLRLKRSARIWIGPVVDRKAGARGGTFGTSEKNVDAYYAHMVYGGARAFRKRVMLTGLAAAESGARQLIARRVTRFKKELAKKHRLARAA